jgi:hypothetical protein
MSDVILLDANVLDQINRGNAAAANALLTRIRNGDQVYISQQAYNEAIVNTLPRQATANRLLLERLNINLAPAGDATIRYDTYAGNATPRVQVLSEADARVAAQARAIGAQVWSFDGAFRNNGNAVTQQLGVRVAAECQLPLSQGQPQDYRVGHRLLGLPPVEITVAGRIIPRGPGGAPPGAPGTPPANITGGGGGGSRSSGGGGGGTVASVGVADNRLPFEGGPSPRGTAIIGGIQLAFQGINFTLNQINDHIQAQRVREALAQLEPQINRERAADPSMGALLIIFYHQVEAHPDSAIRPGPVFSHIETATGRSFDEARRAWSSQAAIRPGLGPREKEFTQEVWIPPIRPAGVAALRTPFPPMAIGRFASGIASKLQNVNWGGVTGFDDESEVTLRLVAGSTPAEFVILRPPAIINWFNGGIAMSTDIPLVTRTTAGGTDLTVVDLDPWIPFGTATAAMVFPSDDATDLLFRQAPATFDNLSQLRRYTNIGKMRWVRPENIRVSRRM